LPRLSPSNRTVIELDTQPPEPEKRKYNVGRAERRKRREATAHAEAQQAKSLLIQFSEAHQATAYAASLTAAVSGQLTRIYTLSNPPSAFAHTTFSSSRPDRKDYSRRHRLFPERTRTGTTRAGDFSPRKHPVRRHLLRRRRRRTSQRHSVLPHAEHISFATTIAYIHLLYAERLQFPRSRKPRTKNLRITVETYFGCTSNPLVFELEPHVHSTGSKKTVRQLPATNPF